MLSGLRDSGVVQQGDQGARRQLYRGFTKTSGQEFTWPHRTSEEQGEIAHDQCDDQRGARGRDKRSDGEAEDGKRKGGEEWGDQCTTEEGAGEAETMGKFCEKEEREDVHADQGPKATRGTEDSS